jgi:hypothetical protein
MSNAAFGDFQQNTRRGPGRPAPAHLVAIVLEAPASSADKVRVQAVGDTSGLYLGEASWPKPAAPKELPAKGDECLVALDNRGAPWIVAWAIPNW